jgi:parvulin-like peptidyl-prolyl isomerase
MSYGLRKRFILSAAAAAAAAAGLILSLHILGCSSGTTVDDLENPVIQVNGRIITLEEFNDQLKFSVYADPELEMTDQVTREFIDYLIQKELMIQEAAKLQLDRKKAFVMTIQKYWESTLIRQLLDLKAEELKKQVSVTDDEAARYYEENKLFFDAPYDQVKDEITRILTSEKLEKLLEQWTDSLRENADIVIRKDLVSQP